MKILGNTQRLKSLLLIAAIMMGRPLIGQENGGGGRGGGRGGLGAVSTCLATPEIAATAIAFTLSSQSGLNGAQAAAQIRNIVHQATLSAPYLPAQIATACVQAISKSATATVSTGQGIPNNTSSEEVKAATAQKSVTTTEGYKEAIAAIAQGAISGTASGGNDISVVLAVCSAIAVELVKNSAQQAEVTTTMKQAGTLNASNEPPINDDANGVEVAKAFVAAASSAAARLGFNPQEVAQIINTAGAAAVATADKLPGQIPRGVTGQSGSQVGQLTPVQVAKEVAEAVALQITASTDTKSTQQGQQTQQILNNNQNAPNPTVAGLPGESQNPFVGPPPIPRPSPTPNPSPTATPTPVPTPTPPSLGGTR
jgi:hypothetical protein